MAVPALMLKPNLKAALDVGVYKIIPAGREAFLRFIFYVNQEG